MIFFAYELQYVKMGLILLILLRNIGKHRTILPKLYIWVFIYVSYNIFSIFLAYLYNNPAPLAMFTIDVLWPILYLLLVPCVTDKFLGVFSKCISYTLLGLIIVGILASFRFNIIHMFGDSFLCFEESYKPGLPIVAISGPGVVSFIILYFFVLTRYLLNIDTKQKIDLLSVFLGVIFILLSTRRAIILDFAISFFIIWLMFKHPITKNLVREKQKFYKYSMFFVITCSLIILYLYSSGYLDSDYLDFFNEAFESREDNVRIEQADALLKGWMERPIFGNGVGVNCAVVRNEIPGVYELSYHSMLFAKGIMGTLLFALLIFTLINWTLSASLTSRYREALCATVSLILFLFANASNPYIGTFDFMFILFLPMIYINLNRNYIKK